jgi:prepilin-type N-terminal cleavage/methylation domain-containing protein
MKRNKDGFTLVELAIVIVIIAVLASVTIFTYAKVQVNARDTARASSVTSITEALEKYYQFYCRLYRPYGRVRHRHVCLCR